MSQKSGQQGLKQSRPWHLWVPCPRDSHSSTCTCAHRLCRRMCLAGYKAQGTGPPSSLATPGKPTGNPVPRLGGDRHRSVRLDTTFAPLSKACLSHPFLCQDFPRLQNQQLCAELGGESGQKVRLAAPILPDRPSDSRVLGRSSSRSYTGPTLPPREKEVPQATCRWQQGEPQLSERGAGQGPNPHPGRLQRPAGARINQEASPAEALQANTLGLVRGLHTAGVILPPRVICPIWMPISRGWVPPVACVGGGAEAAATKATTEAVTPLTGPVTRTGPGGAHSQCPSGSADGGFHA